MFCINDNSHLTVLKVPLYPFLFQNERMMCLERIEASFPQIKFHTLLPIFFGIIVFFFRMNAALSAYVMSKEQ